MNQDIIAASVAGVMPAALATGLFVSTCSISAPAAASGAISGTYTAVTGLQDIVCMDAPEMFQGSSSLSAVEIKSQGQTESMGKRHILLDAYYPQLSPETNWGNVGWRATVVNSINGTTVVYDIIGVEADSQQTQTRLCARKVTT